MRSLVVEVSDGIAAIAGALVVTSVFLARAGETRVRTVLARTMLTATEAMSLSLLAVPSLSVAVTRSNAPGIAAGALLASFSGR